jgi:hypothetical protein
MILVDKCDRNKHMCYPIYLVVWQNSFLFFRYVDFLEMCHCVLQEE